MPYCEMPCSFHCLTYMHQGKAFPFGVHALHNAWPFNCAIFLVHTVFCHGKETLIVTVMMRRPLFGQ